MPTIRNWINLIYVTLAFIVYIVGASYVVAVKEIKNNWPVYRCNPMYMPLSDDISSDFVYCVQNIQTDFMGYLLQPLTFVTGTLSDSLSGMMEEINSARGMLGNIRLFSTDIFTSIFSVFLNLVIEFQKIIIGMRDLMGKTIGTVVTLLYIMDGSMKTMSSLWNGPNGQIVKSLSKL